MLCEKTEVIRVQIRPSAIPEKLTKKLFTINIGLMNADNIHKKKTEILILMMVKVTAGRSSLLGIIIRPVNPKLKSRS